MPKDKQVKKPKGQPAKPALDGYKYAKPSKAFTRKKSWHGVEPRKGKEDFDNSEWTW